MFRLAAARRRELGSNRAAAMQHAPRMSWERLRLPPHGGSSDRPQFFHVGDADADDRDVDAIARALLALLRGVEEIFARVAGMRKGRIAQADNQRQTTSFTYEVVEAYRRRMSGPLPAIRRDAEISTKPRHGPRDGPRPRPIQGGPRRGRAR